MYLRTFFARDMKEALAAMRTALGEDAIIVASETLKDGTMLLRAGTEEAPAPARDAEETPGRDSGPRISATVSRSAAFETRFHENLLARLRGGTPNETQRGAAFDPAALAAILRSHRTPEPFVKGLVEEAELSGLADMTLALATALDKAMRIDPIDADHRGAILLMGPPGAGKTAVAARLAAQHCLAGTPVVLAATDLEAAGQVARLESFAACLNVEIMRVSGPAMLGDAVLRANESQALLIADTGGCDPRESLPPALMSLLSAGRMDLVGILSATGDAEEAGEIAAALVKLGAARLIVTGLDLSRRKGSLVAIALSGAAIAHVTSSPYLADGLETLTPMALARMLTARAANGVQLAA
jgi:flagellar biosynthesis protein FlhF